MIELPSMFWGLQIYQSPLAVTTRKVPKEKNWVQKVLEWNPCNPWALPDYEEITEPTSYVCGDKLICHPTIYASLHQIT